MRDARVKFINDMTEFIPLNTIALFREFSQRFALVWAALAALVLFNGAGSESAQTLAARPQTQTVDSPNGPIVFKTFVNREETIPFQPFTLTLEFETPKDYSVEGDEISGRYGSFSVEPIKENVEELDQGRCKRAFQWQLSPLATGLAFLPPITFRVSAGNPEEFSKEFQTEPLDINVVPFDSAPSVDSIKPDYSRVFIFPVTALVLILAALAILLVAVRRVKRAKLDPSADVAVPKEDPYKKIMRRLAELKNSTAYLENRQEFYSELDLILRQYLSERFELNAGERTSQEVLATIDSFVPQEDEKARRELSTWRQEQTAENTPEAIEPSPMERLAIAFQVLKTNDIRTKIESTFNVLDLVKFARRQPLFEETSRFFSETQDVVKRAEADFNRRMEERRQELKAAVQNAGDV